MADIFDEIATDGAVATMEPTPSTTPAGDIFDRIAPAAPAPSAAVQPPAQAGQQKIALSPAEEPKFKSWYAGHVSTLADKGQKLNPDPDAPEHFYDYRKAYLAGAAPALTEHGDYRWPDLGKLPGHPVPPQALSPLGTTPTTPQATPAPVVRQDPYAEAMAAADAELARLNPQPGPAPSVQLKASEAASREWVAQNEQQQEVTKREEVTKSRSSIYWNRENIPGLYETYRDNPNFRQAYDQVAVEYGPHDLAAVGINSTTSSKDTGKWIQEHSAILRGVTKVAPPSPDAQKLIDTITPDYIRERTANMTTEERKGFLAKLGATAGTVGRLAKSALTGGGDLTGDMSEGSSAYQIAHAAVDIPRAYALIDKLKASDNLTDRLIAYNLGDAYRNRALGQMPPEAIAALSAMNVAFVGAPNWAVQKATGIPLAQPVTPEQQRSAEIGGLLGFIQPGAPASKLFSVGAGAVAKTEGRIASAIAATDNVAARILANPVGNRIAAIPLEVAKLKAGELTLAALTPENLLRVNNGERVEDIVQQHVAQTLQVDATTALFALAFGGVKGLPFDMRKYGETVRQGVLKKLGLKQNASYEEINAAQTEALRTLEGQGQPQPERTQSPQALAEQQGGKQGQIEPPVEAKPAEAPRMPQEQSAAPPSQSPTEGQVAQEAKPQPAENMPQEPPPESPPAQLTAEHPVVELPVADLKLSKDVPNFKEGAAPDTGVVPGEQLKDEYTRLGTGPIVVWERTNGDREVITGRHRLDLARRSGESTIPAQVVREADGFGKADALALDAEANIRDGQGSLKDYATYFRQTKLGREEAQQAGLLSRAKARDAFDAAEGAVDDVYAAFAGGKLPAEKLVAIARGAPGNESAQRAAMSKADSMSADELRSYAAILSRHKSGAATQGNLFGFDDSAMRQAEDVAKATGKEIRSLKERVLAVKGALRRPEQAKQMGLQFSDEESIRQEVAKLEDRISALRRVETSPELYKEMLGKTQPDLFAQDRPAAAGETPEAKSRYITDEMVAQADAVLKKYATGEKPLSLAGPPPEVWKAIGVKLARHVEDGIRSLAGLLRATTNEIKPYLVRRWYGENKGLVRTLNEADQFNASAAQGIPRRDLKEIIRQHVEGPDEPAMFTGADVLRYAMKKVERYSTLADRIKNRAELDAKREQVKVAGSLAQAALDMLPKSEAGKLVKAIASARTPLEQGRVRDAIAILAEHYDHETALADYAKARKAMGDPSELRPEYRDKANEKLGEFKEHELAAATRRHLTGLIDWYEKPPVDAGGKLTGASRDALDPEIIQNAKDALEADASVTLRDLPTESIRQITDALKHITKLNDLKNELLKIRHDKGVWGAADGIAAHVEETNKLKPTKGGTRDTGRVKSYLNVENLPAAEQLAALGPEGEKIYSAVQEGENLQSQFRQQFESDLAAAAGDAWGTKKLARKSFLETGNLKKTETVTFTLESGQKRTVSRSELMYDVLQLRDSQTRAKVLSGPGLDLERDTTAPAIKITRRDIAKMDAALSPLERKLVDHAWREYNHGQLRTDADVVNVRMKGVEKFTRTDYAPRKVAAKHLSGSTSELTPAVGKAAPENAGVTKARTQHNLPFQTRDFFQAFREHMNAMIDLAAVAEPTRDLRMILTNRKAANAVTNYRGKTAYDYLSDQYPKAIAGMSPGNPTEGWFRRIMHNVGGATLAGNMSSMLKQPMGLITMGAEYGAHRVPELMARMGALGLKPRLLKNPYFRARQDSMGVQTIGQGFGGASLVGRQRLVDRAMAQTMQRADTRVSIAAFSLELHDVRKAHPDWTPEKVEAAALDRAEIVVRQTQNPVGTVDQPKMFLDARQSALKATYTMMLSPGAFAYGTVRRTIRRFENSPRAPKDVAKLVNGLGVMLILYPIVNMAMDKLRTEFYAGFPATEPDKKEVTGGQQAVALAGDYLDEQASNFPIVGQAVSTIRGAIEGGWGKGTSSTLMGSTVAQFTRGMKDIAAGIRDYGTKIESGKNKDQDKGIQELIRGIPTLAVGATKLTGLPFYGPYRAASGAYKTITLPHSLTEADIIAKIEKNTYKTTYRNPDTGDVFFPGDPHKGQEIYVKNLQAALAKKQGGKQTVPIAAKPDDAGGLDDFYNRLRESAKAGGDPARKFNLAAEQLSQLREQRSAIVANSAMPDYVKRSRLKTLDKKMVQAAREAMTGKL